MRPDLSSYAAKWTSYMIWGNLKQGDGAEAQYTKMGPTDRGDKPSIPELSRHQQVKLCAQGQCGLHSKFLDRQGYIVRTCF